MDETTLDRWFEQAILAVVVVALALGALAMGGVRPEEFILLQSLVALSIALWVGRLWISRQHRLQWPPVGWFVVAFLAYAFVRYFQADVEYAARLELVRLVAYGWLFFVVLNNLHRQETVQFLTGAVLVVGTAMALYALYQFVTNTNTVWGLVRPDAYRGRGSGTFICPNHLAGYLEVLLPLALALTLVGRGGAVSRVLHAYAALMLLVGIGVSVSRGGYIATALALLVVFVVMFRSTSHRRVLLAGLAVLVVGSAVFVAASQKAQKRFRLMFTPGSSRRHGSLGFVGADGEDVAGPSVARGGSRAFRHSLSPVPAGQRADPPAVVAQRLPQRPGGLGLRGRGPPARRSGRGGGARCARGAMYARAGDGFAYKTSDRAALTLGAGGGLLALAMHEAVDFHLQIPATAMLAATMVALLSSQLRFTSRRYWLNPRGAGRWLLTLLGVASITGLAHQTWQRSQEIRHTKAAGRSQSFTEQATHLHAAVEVEPRNPDLALQLGEVYRLESWEGEGAWRASADKALQWHAIAMRLNRWDTLPVLRYGMTLDWLGRHEDAAKTFEKATELDPNNHYVAIMRGWHELQVGNLMAAKQWLQRSVEIKWWANYLAYNYLALVEKRLAEEQSVKPAGAP